MLTRGYTTRGARGVLGSVPLIVGGLILAAMPHVNGAGLQVALLVLGSGLCGSIYVVCPPMLGEFTPVQQRGAVIGIYSAIYTLAGILAPWVMGSRDQACGDAARRLHDRLHHQRRHHGRIRIARPAAAVAQHRARAAAGPGGAAEIRVRESRTRTTLKETRHEPPSRFRASWRDSGGAAAVPRRSVDRRAEFSGSFARRRRGAGTVGDHDQCPLHRGRLLHRGRAAPRHGDRRRGSRRHAADHSRCLGRRQPAGGADRTPGAGRRGFGAAGVSAGALHARPVAGDGAGPFQDHCGCDRSAADRFSVSAGHRAGLSGGDAGAAVRRSADHPRHQGLDAAGAAAREPDSQAAGAHAPHQRALHQQRMAPEFAGARLQRPAVRLGQRHRRSAGAGSIAPSGPTISRKPAGSTTGSIRRRGCSTPIPSSTCTTA